MRTAFVDAASAAEMIPVGATVGLIGGGGGLVEATLLHRAVEARFNDCGMPRDLTVLHSLGIGDRGARGLNRFAHKGMVRKVIGGHWVWSPRMQKLARDNEIEAFVMPGGVAMQLMREIAAGRPGLITSVGLGTFVDPRQEGGRMNAAAKGDLAELMEIDGREYLRYFTFPIDVALLKGSVADDDGNISLDQEPANVEIYAMAAAARNSGGKVIFQVRERVRSGSLGARSARIPSAIVDAVVVDPDQRQGYDLVYDPAISGERRRAEQTPAMPPFSVRRIIASRACEELFDGAVVNYGFGIPDEVASIVSARGDLGKFYQTIEHGTYGGTLLTGMLFGYARNPTCMIDGPSQFDFYSGGGLDVAFLGFGEVDREGNVNVSKLGGLAVGPGGFIDIAQTARKVVFVGTFEAKGTRLSSGGGALSVDGYGSVRKFVDRVEQITFSGKQAALMKQEIIYVTERAVFELKDGEVELIEIAPGVDLKRDILERAMFAPKVGNSVKTMDPDHFTDAANG
ncbi:MAG: acyl CoA:acetate/3-ketoacid CoA transferase [Albidovulum sp.]|nr:acyl CoA:acetate/3-ketoacid CoA transferase [Albidovulum sp.]MDE0534065.1 acyl CoA:acetate/3-ketoacid CoA transferase [Albidovulum sp.]